ncbi:MAG: tRNA preQ1(34) S-adenosylmethionine ribosyltransferase-isomerase QueA [Hormoscilla sp. GM102CHS1]|nr:tRNA preQ1(34) S-adenosylmethionine ribosyltransferase-isomerase QueA [Hormoscilla sp. GM102CHS1]
MDLTLASYDYELPEDLIAQNPVTPRDSSRLLVVDSPTHHQHRYFHDLPDLLQPGDLLVLNDTRVLRARLYGRKDTGTPVEVLLLEPRQSNCWLALVKPGRRLKPGAKIIFTPCINIDIKLKATVVATDADTAGRLLQFELPPGTDLEQLLPDFGHVPFPPYITASQALPEQYQTVYARPADGPKNRQPGSVAAPTAGLHFTPELLKRLRQRGIEQRYVTLHVGVGTFRPVEVEDVTSHQMHGEWISVPETTVAQIHQTQVRGGRVLAVGTTVARSLEGAAHSGELEAYTGKTELFIYPGYHWRVVDGLITNFHLPRSSLLMLVSAMLGRDRLLHLYREAIGHQYRFYSFGDAMLILPDAWKII